ncbi:hypothetical protein lerEdw1_004727 [Lerista edwardsae]|nr:hypothetical protein lerEdw1_004727 [Lerista edwardsae]
MAENTKVQPSIEGIFSVLASIPENQLLKFKHKLNCTRQDRRNCRLLQAMILLTLKRETEARVSLDALGDDATAAHIYRSHRHGAKANSTDPLSPKQDAAEAVTVAQIYSLLVDEQLCDSQARDEAYRAAVKAAQASNSFQGAKLDSLIDEAQHKCGQDFTVGNNDFSALKSGAGKFTIPAARSFPVPIQNVSVPSDPQPLRSTDTLDSFASHLEISQSPTVPLLTRSVHQLGITESSELSKSASNLLVEAGEGEASLKLPASCLTESPAASSDQDQPKSSLLVSPDLIAAPPLEERVNHPVECTEPPSNVAGRLQVPEGSTPPNSHVSSTLQPGSATQECIPISIEDSNSPAQSTNFRPFSLDSPVPPPLSTGSVSTDPQCDERPFFTFVVLHAVEDEPIACRVKDRLEDMGISNGATFSEDFLVPGHCQLNCFQDALDNSAFTLLLLTKNFKSRICAYQTNIALMDSFTRFLKTDSVIPFVPQENPIKRGEMPTLLSAIVPLDENSCVFATKVKRTFTSEVIQNRRRQWNYMQEIRNRERLQEQYQNYQLMAQRLSEVNIAGCPTQMPFQLPQMGFPGLQNIPPGYVPEPYFQPTFPAPVIPQPQPVPAQPFQSFAGSLGPLSLMPGGPQPHLIIQNAQMVQIGDYNQMQVERTNAALGTADKVVDRNQEVLEGESAGERTEGSK